MDKKEPVFKHQPLKNDSKAIYESIIHHIENSLAKDAYSTNLRDWYKSMAHAVRDRLMHLWHETQRSYYDKDSKRVYYLSMEFLMGRSLSNNMLNMGLEESSQEALAILGQNLEEVESAELDAGLGNGGLGRLAACFVDSMATLDIPGYGYGLRYEYGIFSQDIVRGEQVENADHWLQFGNVWEIERPENTYKVRFGGVVKEYSDEDGIKKFVWLQEEAVNAVAYDTPIPGYKNKTVNTLRLWSAKAIEQFNFSYFNEGDYIKAVEEQIQMENISRVLYPDDSTYKGKRLRLKQQYFFVSATLQDIMRRYKKERTHFDDFSKKIVIQLNDTHPSIGILELMRLLVDVENLSWDESWRITTETFAYTNHTVLPEALEEWPVTLLEELLPRHLQILYLINYLFLEKVSQRFPGDHDFAQRVSLIAEGEEKRVRMAHLAIIGSHKVNGVAYLHTEILKHDVFADFFRLDPQKFCNITNGISFRRWLLCANPLLTKLITEKLGTTWIQKPNELKKLSDFATDSDFVKQWGEVKYQNKMRLVNHIQSSLNITINVNSLFDVQVKRMHEYKRQLLNIMHVIHLYRQIKEEGKTLKVPRTVIFGGKAAPGYMMAKLVIHLINAVADLVNNDADVKDQLKVVFIPNYGVSLAELIIPAADLSEQISTAGMEASGTGNMKFSLNGALTIGTLDGANIEIAENVGTEHMFIFGLTAPQVDALRKKGYDSKSYYQSNPELKAVVDMIANNVFASETPGVFQPLVDELLTRDYFFNMVDFKDYIEAHHNATTLFQNQDLWIEKCIRNVAGMGWSSSDRTIEEYSRLIWGL